ncbi:MAG: hypothetical protein GWN58_13260 [Anaerolineae bacterium]|nr:hypothetical protein [Anaerolineae bacterium]
MEKPQAEELEDLEQEWDGGFGEDVVPSPEMETLLDELRPAKLYTSRCRAAKQLGEVTRSNPQVVQALMTVAETDASAEVRAAAAEALRAPVHQEYLRQHPELTERAQAAARQAKERRIAAADETDTGQSRLAYRLAATVLLVGALVTVADVLISWALGLGTAAGFSVIIRIAIDVGLAIGLLQLRKGARTWVLIRAGVGATLWPIVLFLSNDLITAAIMSVMQWGFCGALLLFLTGQSKTWRLVLGMVIFVVFTLGLFGALMLLVLLASAL